MMGYVISMKNTIIRKKIYCKIFSLFIKIKHKRTNMSLHIARRILSYNGWIKHSNLYLFEQCFDVKALINRAKKVVRYYDKNYICRKTKQLQLLSA